MVRPVKWPPVVLQVVSYVSSDFYYEISLPPLSLSTPSALSLFFSLFLSLSPSLSVYLSLSLSLRLSIYLSLWNVFPFLDDTYLRLSARKRYDDRSVQIVSSKSHSADSSSPSFLRTAMWSTSEREKKKILRDVANARNMELFLAATKVMCAVTAHFDRPRCENNSPRTSCHPCFGSYVAEVSRI